MLAELTATELVTITGAIVGGIAAMIGVMLRLGGAIQARMPDPAQVVTRSEMHSALRNDTPYTKERSRIDAQLVKVADGLAENVKAVGRLANLQATIASNVRHMSTLLEETREDVRAMKVGK